MQAFLISMHFYQRNMEAMYAETEYLLKEVLNEELHRKQQELNLFYISKVTIDTIPLTIRVTTSKGVKTFTVDAKKSKKNISQSMAEPVLAFSCLYEESFVYRYFKFALE